MSTLDRPEARGILEELTEIKSATRARLHASSWQWLVVWCLAFLGSGLTAVVPAWMPIADVYWMYSTPIALVLTVVISSKLEARSPVRQRPLPYWLVGLAIMIASFAAGALLPDEAMVVAVWVIVGFGFAAFAWLERISPAAWLLALMAVLSGILGLLVEDTFHLYPALAFSFSAALAGIITGMRIQSRR